MHSVSVEEPLGPPIFILSTVRSGSTLLRYIIDTHADICCPAELASGRTCQYLATVLSRTVCHAPGPSEAVRPQSLAITRQLMSGIMNAYARSKGKSTWCDKSPSNLDHLDILRDTFPSARFVCLYRHCTDVVQSCLDGARYGVVPELAPYVTRSPCNLVEAFTGSWVDRTESLLEFELANRSRCFRIKYEDLVRNTEVSLREMFAFLGVEWDEDIVTRAFLVPHDEGGGDSKILFTRGVSDASVGKGAKLPVWAIPPALQRRVATLLERLAYPVPKFERPHAPSSTANNDDSQTTEASAGKLREVFSHQIPARLKEYAEPLGRSQGVLKFRIARSTTCSWLVHLEGPQSRVVEADRAADCTIVAPEDTITELATGRLNAVSALQEGRMQVTGNLDLLKALKYLL